MWHLGLLSTYSCTKLYMLYATDSYCTCTCLIANCHGNGSWCLTKLVEVCVNAMRSWYRTHQSGFYEGAPLIDQNSLTSDIILEKNTERKSMKPIWIFTSKETLFIVLALHSITLDSELHSCRGERAAVQLQLLFQVSPPLPPNNAVLKTFSFHCSTVSLFDSPLCKFQ